MITGKIKLYIFDELGEIGDVQSWELHGDLEDTEELHRWKDMKLERVRREYGDERWSEITGFEWDESEVYNPHQRALEEETRREYFLKEVYPSLYPENDWDEDEAYLEWLRDESYSRDRY